MAIGIPRRELGQGLTQCREKVARIPPKEEQLRKIRELNLPCSALVDSGGKSIHAIVKIDAGKDEKLYRERVSKLHEFLAKNGFPVDKACKNASRLSRIAAVTRDGKRQRLIAVNIGGKSYDEWAKNANAIPINYRKASYIRSIDPDDKSDNLIGNRLLCKKGSWLIVAQSGIGKSVLAMQMALHFTVGKSIFGIPVQRPLRTVFIQAENNEIDLARPFHSCIKLSNFSEAENSVIDENLIFISQSGPSSSKFTEFLDRICDSIKPELIIVDPLLAYIGGDVSRQEVCAEFLRNNLQPVLDKHGVGIIFMHHTGKPPKDIQKKSNNSSLSYLGVGSSELTNWARAVSVIQENQDNPKVFEFVHTKRGMLSGSKEILYMRHSDSGVFWEECDKPHKVVKIQKGDGAYNPNANPLYSKLKLETLRPMSKSDLFAYIKESLARLGEPCSDKDVRRVFENSRKTYLVFGETSKLWHGKFYISDSFENKASEGSAS